MVAASDVARTWTAVPAPTPIPTPYPGVVPGAEAWAQRVLLDLQKPDKLVCTLGMFPSLRCSL